jgi:hypothetical protein
MMFMNSSISGAIHLFLFRVRVWACVRSVARFHLLDKRGGEECGDPTAEAGGDAGTEGIPVKGVKGLMIIKVVGGGEVGRPALRSASSNTVISVETLSNSFR